MYCAQSGARWGRRRADTPYTDSPTTETTPRVGPSVIAKQAATRGGCVPRLAKTTPSDGHPARRTAKRGAADKRQAGRQARQTILSAPLTSTNTGQTSHAPLDPTPSHHPIQCAAPHTPSAPGVGIARAGRAVRGRSPSPPLPSTTKGRIKGREHRGDHAATRRAPKHCPNAVAGPWGGDVRRRGATGGGGGRKRPTSPPPRPTLSPSHRPNTPRGATAGRKKYNSGQRKIQQRAEKNTTKTKQTARWSRLQRTLCHDMMKVGKESACGDGDGGGSGGEGGNGDGEEDGGAMRTDGAKERPTVTHGASDRARTAQHTGQWVV